MRVAFKQPNGKFGIWSTAVDAVVIYDLTAADLNTFDDIDIPDACRESIKNDTNMQLENLIFPYCGDQETLEKQINLLPELGYDKAFIDELVFIKELRDSNYCEIDPDVIKELKIDE